MFVSYMNWSSIKSHRTSNTQIKRPTYLIIIPIPTSLPLALSLNRSYALINRGGSDVGIGIIIKYVNPTWPFYFEEIFGVLLVIMYIR